MTDADRTYDLTARPGPTAADRRPARPARRLRRHRRSATSTRPTSRPRPGPGSTPTSPSAAGRSSSLPARGSGRPWRRTRRPASSCRCSTRGPSPSTPAADRPRAPGLAPRRGVRADRRRPVADAGAWPMLQLAAEPEESRRLWAGLPRLPWVLAGKAKPGATACSADRPGDDPIGRRHRRAALRARQGPLGRHRRHLALAAPGRRRLSPSVLGPGRALGGRGQARRGQRLRPLRPAPAPRRRGGAGPAPGPDQRGGRRRRPRPARSPPGSSRPVRDRPDPGEAVAVVPLRPVPGQPRTFEGLAPSLPLGLVRRPARRPRAWPTPLQLDPPPPDPRPEAALEVVARDTSERVELAAARDPLDRLAAATGGRVFADFEADELPALLHARTRTRPSGPRRPRSGTSPRPCSSSSRS